MFKCSKCGGEDQNSDGSCARCSSASLREKLKALVEVWRSVADEWRRAADTCGRGSITDALLRNGICVTNDHADQLAALLAESEPEPCAEWRHCEHDGEDGHIACDVLCADCGMHRDAHPDCEAKAKLPLGHAYCGTEDGRDCKVSVDYSPEGKCWLRCGQPRSAHEPRRGR